MTAAVPEPPHLVTDLKTLCLATMTAEWRPLAAQATRERQPPAEHLAQLVHLEVTGRRERRIQRRLQEARFPMLKTLDAFQFDAQPELDRDAILQLCGGAFVAEAANVVLVGGGETVPYCPIPSVRSDDPLSVPSAKRGARGDRAAPAVWWPERGRCSATGRHFGAHPDLDVRSLGGRTFGSRPPARRVGGPARPASRSRRGAIVVLQHAGRRTAWDGCR